MRGPAHRPSWWPPVPVRAEHGQWAGLTPASPWQGQGPAPGGEAAGPRGGAAPADGQAGCVLPSCQGAQASRGRGLQTRRCRLSRAPSCWMPGLVTRWRGRLVLFRAHVSGAPVKSSLSCFTSWLCILGQIIHPLCTWVSCPQSGDVTSSQVLQLLWGLRVNACKVLISVLCWRQGS